jgi:hypothetical protein
MTVEYLGVVHGIFLNETMLSAILINKPGLEPESVPRERVIRKAIRENRGADQRKIVLPPLNPGIQPVFGILSS